MSIHKRAGKKGHTYQVRYRREDGSQASRTFRTKKEAELFQSKLTLEEDGLRELTPSRRKTTFREMARRWVEDSVHRPRTARSRDNILNSVLLPAFGDRPIRSITHAEVRGLVAEWRRCNLKPNTVRNRVAILRPIMKLALAEGVISKDPTAGLRLERATPTRTVYLTPAECARILESAGDFYRPAFYLLLATGLRISELIDLKLRDVDFARKTLSVPWSKTPTGVREIALSEHDIEVLRIHLRERPIPRPDDADRFFLTPKGRKLNYGSMRARVLKPLVAQSGVRSFGFHDLRRTHGMMLVDANVNFKVVEQRMGHSDIRTTLKYYSQATPRALEKAASAAVQYIASAPADDASQDVSPTLGDVPEMFPDSDTTEVP